MMKKIQQIVVRTVVEDTQKLMDLISPVIMKMEGDGLEVEVQHSIATGQESTSRGIELKIIYSAMLIGRKEG